VPNIPINKYRYFLWITGFIEHAGLAAYCTGRSAVAFSVTLPVPAILKSETTTHPEQRFFWVRELLNTFPNVFSALQGEFQLVI